MNNGSAPVVSNSFSLASLPFSAFSLLSFQNDAAEHFSCRIEIRNHSNEKIRQPFSTFNMRRHKRKYLTT